MAGPSDDLKSAQIPRDRSISIGHHCRLPGAYSEESCLYMKHAHLMDVATTPHCGGGVASSIRQHGTSKRGRGNSTTVSKEKDLGQRDVALVCVTVRDLCMPVADIAASLRRRDATAEPADQGPHACEFIHDSQPPPSEEPGLIKHPRAPLRHTVCHT